MAIHSQTNYTPVNWNDAMFQLWMQLGAAGWQTIAWSDGTTSHNTPIANAFPYSSSSIGFNSPAQAANGRCWTVLQQPPTSASLTVGAPYAGTRQMVIQRHSSDDRQWRIKYSVSGAYTNPATAGTGQNTPVQNASINDEVFICGGGSDASPTFDFVFAGTDGGSRVNIMVDDGYFVSGSNPIPYGFYMISWTAGVTTGFIESCFMLDPIMSGSFPANEPEPFVFQRVNQNVVGSGNGLDPVNGQARFANSDVNGVGVGWMAKNTVNQRFVGIGVVWYTQFNLNVTYAGWPDGAGSNAMTNEDDLLPIPYVRYSSASPPGGYKGLSGMMKYAGAVHSTGTTLSVLTNRDKIVASKVVLPWDGSLPTL